MSVRTFSVFQDSPEETTTITKSQESSTTTSLTTSTSTCSSILESILSCEKENIDPATGSRPSAQQANKKRKVAGANVLATKSIKASTSSSAAGLGKGKRPELKRRSASTSAIPSSSQKTKGKESRVKGDKPRKVLGSSENRSRSSPSPQPTPSRSHSGGLARAPSLDAIPEHSDYAAVEQALIDARCRDLTVSPLADVSEAYLQTKDKSRSASPEREISVVKESDSFERQIRDYFDSASLISLSTASSSSSMSRLTPSSTCPEPSFRIFRDAEGSEDSTPATSDDVAKSKVEDDNSDPFVLSTPQRKQLYAAFTFSSPLSSPTKKTA